MTTTSNNPTAQLPFLCAQAIYRDHYNPDYKGNRFISCLESFETDEKLSKRLMRLPKFDAEERKHPDVMRMNYLKRLFRLRVALPRTISLARALVDLMLAGYHGRLPVTSVQMERQQALYEARLNGQFDEESELLEDDELTYDAEDAGAQFSTAFIGDSGTGKTSALKWVAGLFPPVIYHDETGDWQVPVLIFELPEGGRSKHSLATAIIEALHKRLPHCGYGKLLMSDSWRKKADDRVMQARMMLERHAVGLLLADEAQRVKEAAQEHLVKASAPKQKARKADDEEKDVPLTTVLMRMSNLYGIPLVMTGTPELHDTLTVSYSSRRRGTGHGLTRWGFLQRSGKLTEPDEFEVLLRFMWKYQWVMKPLKLNQDRAEHFFDITQGNPDLMVKLFEASQRRAIQSGIEELTKEVINETYEQEFVKLHAPMKAYKENDPEQLLKYPEIAPLDVRPGTGFAAVALRMRLENQERARLLAAEGGNTATGDSSAENVEATQRSATEGGSKEKQKAKTANAKEKSEAAKGPQATEGVAVSAVDLKVASPCDV